MESTTRRPGTDTPHPITCAAVESCAYDALSASVASYASVIADAYAARQGHGEKRTPSTSSKYGAESSATGMAPTSASAAGSITPNTMVLLGSTIPPTVVECSTDTLTVAFGRKPRYSTPYHPSAYSGAGTNTPPSSGVALGQTSATSPGAGDTYSHTSVALLSGAPVRSVMRTYSDSSVSVANAIVDSTSRSRWTRIRHAYSVCWCHA